MQISSDAPLVKEAGMSFFIFLFFIFGRGGFGLTSFIWCGYNLRGC